MPRTDWRFRFLFTIGAGWIILALAGIYYARVKSVPPGMAAPIVAAFLLEFLFYIAPGFEELRDWLSDKVPVRRLALLFVLSALAPYLLYSLATGQFRIDALLRLAALVLAISFWYVWQRPSRIADLAILAMVATALIARLFFRQIYTSPLPSIPIYVLGHLMLIRLVVSVMLMVREVDGTGFGFLPTRNEWMIGIRWFGYFLPIGIAIMAATGTLRLKVSPAALARAPFWFLAALWVIGLSEEFLARGLLQHWISDWTGRPAVGLLLASAAFGLSHLWYGAFPNWKHAVVAAVMGWFCGKACRQAGGIRAAMVTHALAATAYQTFITR